MKKNSLFRLFAAVFLTFFIIAIVSLIPAGKDKLHNLFTQTSLVPEVQKKESGNKGISKALDSIFENVGGNVEWVRNESDPDFDTEETESAAKFELPFSSEKDPNKSLSEVTLLYVIDGDTLIVKSKEGEETKVRLIGINTEESVASEEYYKENNEWGKMASAFVKESLSEKIDQSVYLEYDKEEKDRYERTLAYVWLSSDTSDINNMLNVYIVRSGYAETMPMEPNTAYAEELDFYCQEAIAGRRGLWADEEFRKFKGIN